MTILSIQGLSRDFNLFKSAPRERGRGSVSHLNLSGSTFTLRRKQPAAVKSAAAAVQVFFAFMHGSFVPLESRPLISYAAGKGEMPVEGP